MSHTSTVNHFRVRPAEPRDCPDILRLIKELAAYENMPNAVKITETGKDASCVIFRTTHPFSMELRATLVAHLYHPMSQYVLKDPADLLRDGFGPRPFFHCLVAEVTKENDLHDADVVGFAMYYFTYDPWIGKLLYLEDFYVMDEFRGWGIGTELLKRLSQIAIDTNCSCMHFLVVVWNKPSIEYYMRRGASDLSTEEGWHLFRFDKENLIRMASGE